MALASLPSSCTFRMWRRAVSQVGFETVPRWLLPLAAAVGCGRWLLPLAAAAAARVLAAAAGSSLLLLHIRPLPLPAGGTRFPYIKDEEGNPLIVHPRKGAAVWWPHGMEHNLWTQEYNSMQRLKPSLLRLKPSMQGLKPSMQGLKPSMQGLKSSGGAARAR